MMRVRRVVRNIGMWGAGLAIAAVFGVACVQPASAEEGTGNMVFFKGGFMNLNQDRSGQIFTDTAGIAISRSALCPSKAVGPWVPESNHRIAGGSPGWR